MRAIAPRSPRFQALAVRALMAFVGTLGLALSAYTWNSRRLPFPPVATRADRYAGPGVLARLVMRTLARTPATRAGFFFTVQCLLRSALTVWCWPACTAVCAGAGDGHLPGGARGSARSAYAEDERIRHADAGAGDSARRPRPRAADTRGSARQPAVPPGLARAEGPLRRRRQSGRRVRPDRPGAAGAVPGPGGAVRSAVGRGSRC